MSINLSSEKKADKEDPPDSRGRRGASCFHKWKELWALADSRRPKMRCLVCLQVHKIRELPSSMNGKALVVGWRRKGWEGEQTLPVYACEGTASFDEIFLRYCNVKSAGALKSFNVWVSSVDAKDCGLGSFHVDLSEMVSSRSSSSNSKFGGKTMSFNLCGAANGSILVVSFYYTIIEAESQELQYMRCDSISQTRSKSKCFSCLPDLKCSKNRSPAGSVRQVASLESDISFITIENSTRACQCIDEDEEGFITIEKGLVRTLSQRPPSDNTRSWDSDEGGRDGGLGKEKLLLVAYEEAEIDQVEDEFLQMLEEKQAKTEECEISNAMAPWEKKLVNLNLNLDLGIDLDFDWDLDSMMRAAEKELLKATQVWKSRIEAKEMENAEYEELMKRWKPDEMTCQGSSSLENCVGFGSPI